MTAKVADCTSSLTWGDHLCDRVPFVSSVTNTLDIFQKSVFVPLSNAKTRCHYYKHLESKSFIRCLTLLIPIIGNIIIAAIDFYYTETRPKALNQKTENDLVSNEKINEAIIQRLSKISLHPYIPEGRVTFQLDGMIHPITEDADSAQFFVFGHFLHDADQTKALISILKDKSSGKSSAELTYLYNDTPLSSQLFFDILCSPALRFSNPRFFEILQQDEDNPLLYIKTVAIRQGDRDQIWTLSNSKQHVDVPIQLVDDGNGGTNFSISADKSAFQPKKSWKWF